MKKKKEMPRFKPKIIKKFEVSFKEEGCISWSAKSEEEAKKIAKRVAKELREEWKQRNSQKKDSEERHEFIDYYVGNYVEYLKKPLWHDTRNKEIKEVIELKKEVMRILSGILNQKIRVSWHQSHFDEGTSYSIDNIKPGEEVGSR